MPAHKGIKLHVISQWELKMHPEFPHPESTQFTFRSPKLDKEAFEGHGHSPATKSNDSKADRLLGRQSSIISVYIPSASGSRFFIRYNVGGAADQGPWFYFKLYMNGRHVTSWGTNTKNRPSGQVMRALFEPGVEWDYKEGKTTYKNPGTEYRPFFFSQEDGDCAAADDGGLIEIKVFRARGRKRRNPQLAQYKDQSKYGVIMPTHGLVEKPQDARYYDWHLKDAKENPFVTFKFHYRSWEHLEKLHLIPPNHPRILEAQVPAMARHLMASCKTIPQPDQPTGSPHTPTKYLGKVYTSDQVHDSLRAAYPPFDLSGSPDDPDERQPWMSRILDTNQLDSLLTAKKDHRDAFIVSSDSTTEPDPFYISSSGEKDIERKIMPITKFSALSIDGAGSTSPHEWLASEYNTRPLPDIPSRTSSAASRASATSRAPSVTPSLLSYIDRDQPSPEPVIGTAIAVSIDSDVSEISIEYEDDGEENEFDEEYNFEGLSALSPPPSRTDETRNYLNINDTTFFFPSKRHDTRNLAIENPPRKDSITVKSYISTASDDNTGTLSLTESEWMRRTPSPVKESEWMRRTPSPAKETIIERLWSPTPEKREVLKNRLLSPERMAEMMELSMTEDDDDLPQQEQETEDNAWDVDRGLDGGAVELVTLHRDHYLSKGSGRENVGVNYDDGTVSGDYEVNAMKMRENRSGSSPESFENRMGMRDGNWI
ncbi:uncharacterized protein Bfra_004918 [Botrytis fragariae]|uniref:DUF7918 domain-containing protein n=1 Tax=Botrytis fragariae TaxID=1964551 RepID=A0A8H6ATF3_9HELO|nr:uncharacterized protein Bfra_004918 [Botrytis fragariae]KAF5873458.1 hypothetical protein Bfra_004918 [Botrytis fragariae]